MHARFALVAGTLSAVVSLLHCAGSKKAPEQAPASPPPSLDASAEGGAGGAPEAPPEHPRPDPALVQKALDRTGTPTAEDSAAHGLRFEVVEIGPSKSWALAVVNRGNDPMIVAFDPRLLSFEIAAAPDPNAKKGKKPEKPRVCRLPDELRPARAEAAYTVMLAPGHGLVEAFDPRLYCLPQGGVSAFTSGARVSASLGWPVKTKTVWRKGKREEEVPPQDPPFVAVVAPAVPDAGADSDAGGVTDDAGAAPSDAGSEIVMMDTTEPGAAPGIKELHSTPFELGGDYVPPPKPVEPGLGFELTRGSDATDESGTTVTVQLSNHGKKKEQVYFRRELITLEVSSVDGTQMCVPEPRDRSPDRQAFTHLAPGGSISFTSRLAELCPKDTFARPGLYLVHGGFDGVVSGSEFGFDAFVGHLTAEQPATVRVRKGTLPFPGQRALEEVQVGATGPR